MTKKNIIYFPYHDWRKIQNEGARTRDAHFINALKTCEGVDRLLIINRPTTFAELILKKKTFSKKLHYKIIFNQSNATLYQLESNVFLIDYLSSSFISQIINGRKWFFSSYKDKQFKNFVSECENKLELSNSLKISANIMAASFFNKTDSLIFDAWDNFLKMPGLKSISKELSTAYESYAKNTHLWVTNSKENKEYYSTNFGINNSRIITNGVDYAVFKTNLLIPKDLSEIKSKGNPIAGFGGKITHLFDVDLFNFISKENPNISFVILGQILDDVLFNEIILRDNVHYLGDKKYNDYPNYVSNFDIGIVPYKTGNNQHGGDSIKVYEYLSCQLTVVGTNGNGLQNLSKYIDITNDKKLFSNYLKNPSSKEKFNPEDHSWNKKTHQLLNLFDSDS